jgi:uncharacterized FlaG/YvyC family protein
MSVSAIGDARMQAISSQNAGTESFRKVASNVQEKVSARQDATVVQAWDALIQATENNRTVQITFDKEINRTVIQVVDGQSQKVVAQIPSPEIVAFMKRFKAYVTASTEGRV